jgi:hypothetical protein
MTCQRNHDYSHACKACDATMLTDEILVEKTEHPLFNGSFRWDEDYHCPKCNYIVVHKSQGTGWGSSGWMCAKIPCPGCGKIYVLTDSRLFCLSCDHDRKDCKRFPQIFAREDIKGHLK